MQLPQLVYIDATNIEAGAHSVWPATGPTPGAGLFVNIAVGKRLSQFGDAHVSDLGCLEKKLAKACQACELYEPRRDGVELNGDLL